MASRDMDDIPSRNDPLADARKEFRAFYSIATESDAVRMDTLINKFSLLTLAIRRQRPTEDPKRAEIEKVTTSIERAFIDSREAVRGCQTFKALCAGDQRRIENVLFSPFPPWER